jgi:hypothetical protein
MVTMAQIWEGSLRPLASCRNSEIAADPNAPSHSLSAAGHNVRRPGSGAVLAALP